MFTLKRIVLSCILAVSALSPLIAVQTSSAFSGADWQAGRIIDDMIFTNKDAMSVADIQNFLNQQVGTGPTGYHAGQCDTNGVATSEYGGGTRAQYGAANNNPAPFTCLKDYYEVPKTAPGPGLPASNYGGAPIPAGAESAAQLIWDAAQKYNISPKVLLVMIQKESPGPLITDDWPFKNQYTYALGAHCPDGPNGAQCDPNYAGFSIQVSESASLLRYYLDNMYQPWWTYKKPGNNTILYNPNTACGSTNVSVATMATAALYTYTPYQPNAAALSNLWGTGDSCSSYGNRNFWRIYNEWFGIPTSNARLYITQYNATTDNTGGAVWLGFSLSQQPISNVTVPLRFSPNAPAQFASAATVTITPQTWNRPDLNKVVIRGDTGTTGTQYYTLMTDGLQTSDPNFSLLTVGYTPDITLTQMDVTDTSVYRLYNPNTGQHLYTASQSERTQDLGNGYNDEGTAFNYCSGGEVTVHRLAKGNMTLMIPSTSPELQAALNEGFVLDGPVFSSSRGSSVPVYRLYNPTTGDHLFTLSASENASAAASGYNQEGTPFTVCSSGQKPVYRLFNPQTQDHFYTSSPQERDSAGGAGYVHEGAGFYLCGSAADNPVYRLYNPSTRKHFYTDSPAERTSAVAAGYTDEGVQFSTCTSGTNAIYRLFNKQLDAHFFTPSSSEANSAISNAGYVSEGAGFYTGP